MAEIKRTDIFAKKVFTDPAEEAKELDKALNMVEKSLKDIAKLSANVVKGFKVSDSKDLKEFNEVMNQSKKAVSDLDKFEKKRLATLEKLNEANSERVQDLTELQVQLKEQNKANRQLVEQNAKIVGSYKAQSTRLIKLRKEYKDLRIEKGKDTKETIELKKEIEKLDKELKEVDASVGQFQREVGNYEKAVEGALESTKNWAIGLTSAAAALELVNNTIESSEEGSEGLASIQNQLSAAFSVTTNSLFNTASGLFELIKGAVGFEQTAEEQQEALDKLTDSFDNYGDRIAKATEAADEATKANFALEKSSRGLRLTVAELNGEIEKQNLIAGDSTRSFDEIAAAANRSTILQIQRATILRSIAEEELKIIDDRIEALGEDANAAELLNEQAEKRIELQELQNELDLATLDNQKILRETTRDRFEQELDFAIDFFDNQKTLLERQIGLEDQSFEQRADNLKKLQILAESSFNSQIELINTQVGQNINLRELVKIEDERLVRQKLITDFAVTDEITTTRILEVLRERKTVTQDIADAERDINAALKESIEETQTLVNELDQVLKQGQIDATEDFEQQLDLRKIALEDQADFEIMLAEGNAEQIELIQARLANDLAALERERTKAKEEEAEKREAIEEEESELVKELARDTFELFKEELAKKDEARLESFDTQISDQEKLIEKLRDNAVKGTEEALAFEEAQLEKQRLARQREEERQAKRNEAIQLAQTFLNQVAEQSKENPDTAIAEAFKNTFLARAIARGLAGFFEGTDDTGSGDGNLSDKYGNITGYTHENEMVFSAKQKAALGHKSRDEIIDIVQDYDAGNTWAFMPRLQEVEQPKGLDLSEVIASNNRVEKAVRESAVHSEFDLTGFNYWIEERIKGSQKEVIKHMIEKFRR